MASKYSLKHTVVGNRLLVNYTGLITNKEMVEIMDKIYSLLRANYVDTLLIDARGSEVFLEFRESLDFASNHPSEFQKVKTAVIENKTKEAQYKLYEMFVKNRDVNLRFFTDMKEAQLWLGH
ncbi:MAG: hypothetical protein ACHQRM_15250 [Bacteroidia bacterium]